MKKAFKPLLVMLLTLILSTTFIGCADSGGSGGSSSTDTDTDTDGSIDIVINNLEVDTSSGDLKLTLLVSAVDENGLLIETLEQSNFRILLDGASIDSSNITFQYLDEQQLLVTDPVSVAILMDYSATIIGGPSYPDVDPAIKQNMEDAVTAFINQKRDTDEAAILKFNSGIRNQWEFSTDINTLLADVAEEVQTGSTYLYDGLYTSIEAVAARANRPFVVAITDGDNEYENGVDPNDHETADSVIELAQTNQIPLILVGLGSDINASELQTFADETGGHFYAASESSELAGIYGSIYEVINEGRYEMVMTTSYGGPTSALLSIRVEYNGLVDTLNTTIAIP